MSKTNPKLIDSIVGYENGSEKEIVLKGRLFIDATGDGVIAYQAGAEFRMGREARSEFEESLAPEKADNYTQGSSLLFHARDVGFRFLFRLQSGFPSYSVKIAFAPIMMSKPVIGGSKLEILPITL